MEYTLKVNETELEYIRRALCDKNMYHGLEGLEAKNDGYYDVADFHMSMRKIGLGLLHIIDKTKEYQ